VQQRELVAREQIALEQVKIENLKQDIQTCSEKVDNARKKRFSLLGTDEQGYASICSSLDNIIFQLQTFSSADVSDIVQNQQIIDSLHTISNNLKQTTRYGRIDSLATKMQLIEEHYQKITSTVSEYLKKSSDTTVSENASSGLSGQGANTETTEVVSAGSLIESYTVSHERGKKRESLFKIAGYPQVYGDPYQWKKLYRANKELIDKNYERYKKLQNTDVSINPQDVIFPGQVLKIPR
jgi:DNA mismatch repair ATPase MutS